MNWKQLVVTCGVTAGLLFSSVPLQPSAHAETSLSLSYQGSTISAGGVYSQNGVPLGGTPAFLTVRDANNNPVHVDQVRTQSDGSYKFEWTMPNQAIDGATYTVNVFIERENQTVSFVYQKMTDGSKTPPINIGSYRYTGELNPNSRQVVSYHKESGLTHISKDGRTTVSLDADKVNMMIRSATAGTTHLTISVPTTDRNSVVTIPGSVIRQLITSFGPQAHVLVATETGACDLPLMALNSRLLDNVQNGANSSLTVRINEVLSESVKDQIDWQLVQMKAPHLLRPIEFAFDVNYAGQTIPLNDFSNSFVKYSINLTGSVVDKEMVQSALFLNPRTGELLPTPSKLYKDTRNITKLVMMRTGNGVFVPTQSSRDFLDAWNSKNPEKIRTLASKYVVNGKTATKFDPLGSITRAEFATLMVRALGVADKQGASAFYDVKDRDWFRPYVAIGSSLGLISGFEDNNFKPNDNITREQMASLLARTLQYVQTKPYVDTTRILGQLTDRDLISTWAREDVALAISTGIIDNTITKLDPKRPANRAESAEMLYNLLNYLKMM